MKNSCFTLTIANSNNMARIFKDCVAFKLNWREKQFAVQCSLIKKESYLRDKIFGMHGKTITTESKNVLRSTVAKNHCKAHGGSSKKPR